uniref:Protein tweety homolog n=1 Tax=Steinernema glaseri TaxID=37863 RepID=A0A1I7Z1X1_9BILA
MTYFAFLVNWEILGAVALLCCDAVMFLKLAGAGCCSSYDDVRYYKSDSRSCNHLNSMVCTEHTSGVL